MTALSATMESKSENEKSKKLCSAPECKKKLSLVQQTTLCKCSKAFCGTHRHAETHSCNFDYQAKSQRDLSNSLVKLRADKVEAI